jgi:hypothetical protein
MPAAGARSGRAARPDRRDCAAGALIRRDRGAAQCAVARIEPMPAAA